MAIPGTPFDARFAFLDMYRVAHALSHVVQFLNLFRCCHSVHLSQLYNEKFSPNARQANENNREKCGLRTLRDPGHRLFFKQSKMGTSKLYGIPQIDVLK